MSLSSGTAGGKGVDSNAVDTYDSGDEWDIGVGNLIIDLDADLEKDKLEMSGTKDGDGMATASSAVAALPDNIKFINPVPPPPIKDSKSKAKRNGGKKDAQGRTQNEGTGPTAGSGSTTLPSGKGSDKSNKASRNGQSGKKDKDGSGKSKKEKNEGVQIGNVPLEKDPSAQVMPLGQARNTPFEGTQSSDLGGADQLGNITLDTSGIVTPLAIKSEPEEVENNDCRSMKKVKSEKVSALMFSLLYQTGKHLKFALVCLVLVWTV
ncbi:hypothetical protein PO909_022023 [Leuciscus waleckii]